MLIPSREGKCCDAVIRHIERSSGSIRTEVVDPEKDGGVRSVDLKVKVGDQDCALEHTRVQPFRNRIDLATQWQTVKDCVKQWFPDPLPGPAFYHLYIPLDMHPPGRGKRGKDRLRSLREWIEQEVEILHRRAAWRPRSPGHFYIMDERSGRHRTILILEVIQPLFVYDVHICKHLPALLEECPAPPDDIFIVVPHRDFWEVWVVKRGEVHWPDERLPMPHKGYQEFPEEMFHGYPPKLAEAMDLSLLRTATRAEWRPYFPNEAELENLESN